MTPCDMETRVLPLETGKTQQQAVFQCDLNAKNVTKHIPKIGA